MCFCVQVVIVTESEGVKPSHASQAAPNKAQNQQRVELANNLYGHPGNFQKQTSCAKDDNEQGGAQ